MESMNLSEAISFQARRKRAMTMRKLSSKLRLARERAMKRMPTSEGLMNRARKQAIKVLKEKLTHKSTGDMSPQEKSKIEDRIKKMPAVVDRLARKLLKKVKSAAIARRRGIASELAQGPKE